MSYDIYLRGTKCDVCGNQPWGPTLERGHPTYNLTPIFDLALTGEPLPNPDVAEAGIVLLGAKTDRPRGLRVLSGRTAGDTVPMLKRALLRIAENPAMFRALQPGNGWGDLPGAVKVLEEMHEAARDYPELVWEIR
jgi:hypothetical protein